MLYLGIGSKFMGQSTGKYLIIGVFFFPMSPAVFPSHHLQRPRRAVHRGSHGDMATGSQLIANPF